MAAVAGDGLSVEARLGGQFPLPWVRPDGVHIAKSADDLVAGAMFAPPHALDGSVPTQAMWLGATDFSTVPVATGTCTNWTDTAGTGDHVTVNGLFDAWGQASGANGPCSVSRSVLCLQVK
jgi:hypothetical protein